MDLFYKINCPICGNTNSKIKYALNRSDNMLKKFNINSSPNIFLEFCNNCGHYYSNPIIKNIYLQKYYKYIDSEFYDSKNISKMKSDKIYINSNTYLLNKIFLHKKSGSVLEIGCGYGFFLSLFNKDNWSIHGVEPSPKAYKYARDQINIDVKNTLFDYDLYPDNFFDLILLIDVIEHLSNPNRIMDIINKIIKKNGILVIKTGSIDRFVPKLAKSNWCYFGSMEHISFYTKNSISFLIKKHKMEIINIENISHRIGWIYNFRILVSAILKNFAKSVVNKIVKDRKYLKRYPNAFDHFLIIAKK